MKYHFFIILFFCLSNIFGQNGQVTGIVTDATNNEVVPFANIVVDGTQIGTTSDFDGKFLITGLEPGYINLRISFIGYKQKLSSDIFISNSNIPTVEIQLVPIEEVLDEVVIRVDPFEKRVEAPLSMQRIGAKEIENNPGSNRDISRVIQSFPGVGSTPAYRNDIIVRGGGPSENRFYLDDVEIPVINHFSTQGASGGPVGIVNADFIQTLDFYSGSFPATRNNALSGIMDFKQKEGSNAKTNVQFSVGASEAALTLDGPIGEKTTYIFSVRRSYLQFLFSAIGLPFLPTFNDYQLKLKTRFDRKNQFTLISIGSLDNLRLNTSIENPDASQEYILSQIPVNNQWSYTIGGVYKHFFDDGFHTVVVSRNMLNNSFYKYPDNDENMPLSFDYKSTEAENKLRYELSLMKKGYKINLSALGEYATYTNSTSQQIFVDDSVSMFEYNSDLNMVKYGFSAQVSKSLLQSRMMVSLGMRFDGNTYNSKMSNMFNQFSPRVSLSYALTEKFEIVAGVGRYFQSPAYTTLGFRDEKGDLINESNAQYIGVNQYNIGVEYRFNTHVVLSGETFYKDYFQYPIDLITGASLANEGAEYSSVAGAVPAAFYGTGEAVGFELVNRINYSKFTLLATYTYVRSLFSDIDGQLISSSWDSRHLFTVTASRELKRNWRIGAKWRFVGGLPYTPYDLEKSANVEAWNAIGQPYYDYSQLNEYRFSSFHQLDVRVDKNYFYEKFTLMLYIDIQNLYNFQTQGQDYIIREKNTDGTYKTINNGQDYVLEEIPNSSGTVLPTIGIMVKF